MKLQIGYPVTGLNKTVEIDDDNKLRAFYDKRMSHEVEADHLGPEFKGYVFKITGGSDKQGFPMKQGVLVNGRVSLLLNRGDTGLAAWRCRKGERRRKSVRGCIVGPDVAVLNLIIVQKGEKELPGLTDSTRELTLGPKRASKIRKLFNLTKKDDVRKFVIRHKKVLKSGKVITKAPKIQRLVTPERIYRKKRLAKITKIRKERRAAAEATYETLLSKRKSEAKLAQKTKRQAVISQKRSQEQRNKSLKEKASGVVAPKKVVAPVVVPAAAAPVVAAPVKKAAAPVVEKKAAAPVVAEKKAAAPVSAPKAAPVAAAPAKKAEAPKAAPVAAAPVKKAEAPKATTSAPAKKAEPVKAAPAKKDSKKKQ